MALFPTPRRCAYTLRALSHLLRYPGAELREHLPELAQALHDEAALGAPRLAELDALVRRLQTRPALRVEAEYVEMFDRGRGTALHLFEHVHGDSRDRGPAMIDLARTYAEAGLDLGEGELPDFLPVVLEYASTQPGREARAFVAEFAHVLQAIFSALRKRESPYASAVAALLDLAGERAQAVPLPEEPELDATWAEPAAFDGCARQGQSRPGTDQPIRIVKPARDAVAPGARP